MGGTLVFEYGSLRRGGFNDRLMAEAEFVGEARTAGRCALYVCPSSGLPYLTLDPVCQIKGELYRVNSQTLRELDGFEGSPESYLRMEMAVEVGNAVVEADVYVWLHETTNLDLVESGNWLDTLDEAQA